MIKELRDFLFKANVLDLAVAVIVAAAFNAIITSLVEDVITPLFLTPALKAAGLSKSLSYLGMVWKSSVKLLI